MSSSTTWLEAPPTPASAMVRMTQCRTALGADRSAWTDQLTGEGLGVSTAHRSRRSGDLAHHPPAQSARPGPFLPGGTTDANG
ncbi:hypothetical protein [Cellulomonas sp.]|uniref:hypothetical protein n=1 Tax=Cellulomonas sp. TaxID=40001 RepID=UPI003BAC7121